MSDVTLEGSRLSTSVDTITIGTNCRLTLLDAKNLAKYMHQVNLNSASLPLMERSHALLKTWLDQRLPIYGINTHFGDQVNLLDENLRSSEENYYESIKNRQENLIRSHTCGLGDVVPAEIIRVAMMLRIHCLSQGYSGVTPSLTQNMIDYLNAGITPVVRRFGSIGASGDLIPLAMIASGMTGQNTQVFYRNEIMSASEAITLAGLKEIVPSMRDGLAMINGTSFMTSIASIAVYNMQRLFKQMLSAVAMTLESMLVITSAYHPLVHKLKQQAGEIRVNEFLLDFWKDSALVTDLDELRNANLNEEKNVKPVQDYYSLRSVAQGFGPFEESLMHAIDWIENEMNSVNDNPIIDTAENKIHHNANFMGYYVTEASDKLKMDIAQASTWIHALLANLVHPRKNHNLPANIVENPGRNNGFRPIQLLAASLAVQNRKLAQSHQAFMLPTEGDNQDVNSLGTHAAFDLRDAAQNLERLTAILFLAASQALEMRGIEKAGPRSRQIYETIRKHSATVDACRPMSDDIATIVQLLEDEKI